MALTAIGRAALVAREALKTRAYKDSVGVWTIGVGHTSAAGAPKVTPGLVITEAEALDIFAQDLVRYEAAVDRGVTVPIADHERDALVSICFNIGPGTPNPRKGQKPGFLGSTFLKRLNAGDRAGCAAAIMSWTKPPEVTTRRMAERDQFLAPYSVAMPKARSNDRAPVKVGPGTAPAARRPATDRMVIDDVPAGYEIEAAQRRLIALKFHDVGLVDGKPGKKFSGAVRQLQQRAIDLGERVAVDGIYGPQTRRLLDAKHGTRYQNHVSDERKAVTEADLARVGTPAVVAGRSIQWTSLLSLATTLAGVAMLAFQNYQAGTDTLPWAVQAALNFMPPWVAMLAPAAFALYSAAVAKGLIGSAVERVREGIDNSGRPPSDPAPGGLFGSLFGGR